MNRHVKIGWVNRIDTAVLTASASIAGLPVGNLKAVDVVRVWNAGTASVWLLADFGAAVELDGTALIGTNLTANAVRRVRVSSDDATGAAGDVLDTGAEPAGVDPAYRSLVYPFAKSVAGRYLRVDLEDSSLSEITAGRWWAGPLYQPSTNFSYGWNRRRLDSTQRSQTPGGQSHANRGVQLRALDLPFQFLTEVDAENFIETMQREVGLWGDLLVIRDPGSINLGRDSLWGQLTDIADQSNIFFRRYRTTLSVIERK